jgi:hypothetical protein
MNNSNLLHGYIYLCMLYISVENVKSDMKKCCGYNKKFQALKVQGNGKCFAKKSEFAFHVN